MWYSGMATGGGLSTPRKCAFGVQMHSRVTHCNGALLFGSSPAYLIDVVGL